MNRPSDQPQATGRIEVSVHNLVLALQGFANELYEQDEDQAREDLCQQLHRAGHIAHPWLNY